MSGLPDPEARLAEAVRLRAQRRRDQEDGPGFARNLGQIGALGWTIVLPALIGLAIGRWLDHRMATRIFWTAPLLMVGIALGCWSGWRWVNRR